MMRRKLILLLDLDDVLNNQNEIWVRELNQRHGVDVAYKDILEWDMSKAYLTLNKIDLYEPVLSPLLVPQMSAPEDMREYTYKWHSAGHMLMVATSTSARNVKEKVQWLYVNYRWFDETKLILTHKKQMLRGDMLLDDGVHNLLPDKETGMAPSYVKVCLDRPWNSRADCLGQGIHRARNIAEVDEVVCGLEKRIGG